MGLSICSCGASLRVAGIVSWQKFNERGVEILVNMKATLLVNGLGKTADKVDNMSSMPTVQRGTVPLMSKRTTVMESTCFFIRSVMLFLWSSSC